jgi:hypothetical protein
VAALSTLQLCALAPLQKAALSTTQTSALSATQIQALLLNTPLMLDLSGDGIHTLAQSAGVAFDIDADGRLDRVGWVGPGDGLLVRDRNANGVIDSGAELFGSATPLDAQGSPSEGSGVRAADGFQALAALDANGDGSLNALDAEFAHLSVWQDANADGRSDPGEVLGLQALGITAFDVQAQPTDEHQSGNWIGLRAGFQRQDGSVGALADVWLQTSPLDEQVEVQLEVQLVAQVSALGDAIRTYAAGPVNPTHAGVAGLGQQIQAYVTQSSGAGVDATAGLLQGVVPEGLSGPRSRTGLLMGSAADAGQVVRETPAGKAQDASGVGVGRPERIPGALLSS